MMMKNIFWGTGKIGRDVLSLWRMYGMSPEFFCDNNERMWGEKVDGVEVISPKTLFDIKTDIKVFVTCIFWEEICQQLIENGVPQENIIRADALHLPEVLCQIEERIIQRINCVQVPKTKRGYLIDLSCGMVLGGVERWSYSLAAKLAKQGETGLYLLPDDVEGNVLDNTFPMLKINRDNKFKNIIYYEKCIEWILNCAYSKVICNFPFEIMQAACCVKKYYRPELQIAFVIHNDEENYYRVSVCWDVCIDKYYVISKKIKRTLMEYGISESKIQMLYWNIPCEKELIREYSDIYQPLKIGYAGRITIQQKRVDNMLQVAIKLKQNGVLFQMEIAGAGDYLETFINEVEHYALSEYVKFVGIIEHEKILDFWKKQDICISCSDFEGHSIAQSEAMAAGAVLVITNTSGAEDDVESGYNGYVVDVGDVDGIVEKIQFLEKKRELLEVMGQRSHKIISERNQMANYDLI